MSDANGAARSLSGTVGAVSGLGSLAVLVPWMWNIAQSVPKPEEVSALRAQTEIALQVARDHGTEIEGVRQEMAQLRGSQVSLAASLQAEIARAADDRFFGRDGKELKTDLRRELDRIWGRLEKIEGRCDMPKVGTR